MHEQEASHSIKGGTMENFDPCDEPESMPPAPISRDRRSDHDLGVLLILALVIVPFSIAAAISVVFL